MWFLVFACATPAEVVDACVETPEVCTACTEDADCAYQGNACTETVYCASVGAGIAVVEIGCSAATEHPWPDPDTCTCQAGVCVSTH